jgi:hypothetical protein
MKVIKLESMPDLDAVINELGVNPCPHEAKALKGTTGLLRVRVGA